MRLGESLVRSRWTVAESAVGPAPAPRPGAARAAGAVKRIRTEQHNSRAPVAAVQYRQAGSAWASRYRQPGSITRLVVVFIFWRLHVLRAWICYLRFACLIFTHSADRLAAQLHVCPLRSPNHRFCSRWHHNSNARPSSPSRPLAPISPDSAPDAWKDTRAGLETLPLQPCWMVNSSGPAHPRRSRMAFQSCRLAHSSHDVIGHSTPACPD